MTTAANLSEQILALPNGAGAVQSIGQTFEVRPYTGIGSYAIPIETKPGHAGISPALLLTYSTHAGSGIAGVGWSLSLARIERRTDKGLPGFDDALDTFALQGDELLAVGGGHYRLRIDDRFARIRHVREGGRNFWVVTERDGTRIFYGFEADHRLHDDTGKVAAWYASRKQDAHGNEVVFVYTRDATTKDVRLASVEWSGCYRVSLRYEARPDPVESYRAGFRHVQSMRLAEIDVEVASATGGGNTECEPYFVYRAYRLAYAQSAVTGRSLLAAVTLTCFRPDGARHALPPLTFRYTEPDIAERIWHSVGGALPGGSLKDRNLTLVRQSGSGLPDILETTGTGHWIRENLGQAEFATPRRVASPAQTLLEDAGTFISDMDGNGWGDLVVNGGDRVYRGLVGGGWGSPYAFAQSPSVDLDAPDVRLADLNGDGLPDALRAGVRSWVFFQNLGEGRWAPGVSVLNAPPLRLDDPRVHLTDVNGDGLPDVVYMEQQRIRVWPGMGWGRFGAPYELRNPPDFGASFDPLAVRWADLTGSGMADLLYVHGAAVQICLNHGQSGLSDPLTVATMRQSSHGEVEPVDLLGTGTQGLLLTDRQERAGAWRFLELFPEGRPDLLSVIENGLGATTTIAYSSSAEHWIADKLAGQPWRTAMPSPEIVVSGMTVVDAVTGNRLGVTYRYHHGVYDGNEREFRGFALVEERDLEAARDDPLPLAQVLIKRWYHTGLDVDLRDLYSALPEGTLADEVPALAWARRSLRSRLRREETLALDGRTKPYFVRETAYRVFPVAQASNARQCSFAPLPIKSRMTCLERSDERRILETTTTYDRHYGNGYGLPLEVREKGYGRRGASTSVHELAQAQDLERFTRTTYVNREQPDGDWLGPYEPSYLVGKPAAVERHGVTASGSVLLSRECYFYDGADYEGLGYPGTAGATSVTRGRLSCKLALASTEEMLSKVYPSDFGARARFEAAGHYLTDGDAHYVHAARYRYDGRGMIVGSLDPNGNELRFEYDAAHGLFPVLYSDAAGHPTRVLRDVLPFQVAAVLDANGNTTSFSYDPTGLPASMAAQGKYEDNEWSGDPPTHPTETYRFDFASTPVALRVEKRQRRLGSTFGVVRYLDGLGRTIQERNDAEPDPATGAARYRVTGWRVLNHKGLVVRAYQPSFSGTDRYGEGDDTTAFIATAYDPLGRPLSVEYPDGTFESTTYHPWILSFADRNDNARSVTADDARYGRFLDRFRDHLETPTLTYLDAFGRTIATVEDNGDELHITRKVMDLKDQLIEVWDARGLTRPTWTFAYDGLGRSVRSEHSTGLGVRHALADAAGNAIWARDARGIETIRSFDALNRPTAESSVEDGSLKLRRQWRYVAYDPGAPDFAVYQAKNLFQHVEEERDADGLRYFEYDWRGLVTTTRHRFWSQVDSQGRAWDVRSSELWTRRGDWDPETSADDRAASSAYLSLPDLADPTTLTITTTYDSAQRPIVVSYPEGLSTRATYNNAGLLSRLEVDRGAETAVESIVDAIQYDARGELAHWEHGNGVATSREYDASLQRLTRIFTRRGGTPFQDLGYAYDPAGNPVEIVDHLSESSFSHNQIIPNTRTFAYDARYRLVKATGKKHRTVRRKDSYVLVTSPDRNDYEPYTIRYVHDAVGNFERNGEYSTGPLHYKSGRIDLFNGDTTEAGSLDDPGAGNFRYDANGNAIHTPRHETLAYTHDNQPRYIDMAGGGQVRYFRHRDRRVVRMVNKNGVRSIAIYLGPFEYHLRRGATRFTKVVLQVMGHGRHAEVERILAGADPDSRGLFFHHGDHLGSGHVLTSENGSLMSQEEYFPFGGTSDRRDARNRYRFIGVERDEDTRLDMTGPRTFDSVCGRFLQPDPLAADRFDVSPFVYASASPIARSDPSGYTDGTDKSNSFDWEDLPEGGPVSEGAPPEVEAPRVATPAPELAAPRGAAGAGGGDDFFMTSAEIKEYKQWVADRVPDSVSASMDVKGGWTLPDDPRKAQNDIHWAEFNGADSAEHFTEAQRAKRYGELIGDNNLIAAADDVIKDVTRATAIRAAAYAEGSMLARAGLQAASQAGLDMAAAALAEIVAPGVGGAVMSGAQSTRDVVSGGLKGIIYALPFIDFNCNDIPRPPPPPEPTPIDREIARLQALEDAGPPSETTPPLYKGPCEICHW